MSHETSQYENDIHLGYSQSSSAMYGMELLNQSSEKRITERITFENIHDDMMK